jgi:membrane protein
MKPAIAQEPVPVTNNNKAPAQKSGKTKVSPLRQLRAMITNIKDRLKKVAVVQLIIRTIEGAANHDAGQRAAGMAYYSILSVFPLLLGLIAVFGFFLPSVNLQDTLLKYLGTSIPGASAILEDNIAGIIRLRGVMSLLSIVILFWGGSGLFGAISVSINRAWDISRNRPFLIRKANELAMAVITGALFVLSLGSSALSSVLRSVTALQPADRVFINLGSRLIAFLLMFVVFLLLYKFVPYVKTRWRYIWQGALLAAVLFELARSLFIIYLENFANYALIYGSIASIIALLVWIYYSSLIMIMGAEFTFQYDRFKNAVAEVNSTAR